MSAKHTPGPWFVVNQYREDDPRGSLVGPRDYPVCSITGYHRDEHSANARLIAAAPEMLEALKEALGFLQDMNVIGDLPDTMRAAIAKAEGR